AFAETSSHCWLEGSYPMGSTASALDSRLMSCGACPRVGYFVPRSIIRPAKLAGECPPESICGIAVLDPAKRRGRDDLFGPDGRGFGLNLHTIHGLGLDGHEHARRDALLDG